MKRRLCLFAILMSLLLCLSVLPTAAAAYPAEVVFDNAGLLTESEKVPVTQSIDNAWKKADCGFYLVTYPYDTVRAVGGREYLGEYFLQKTGLSENSDLVILILHQNGGIYYYDMFYYGDAPRKISQKEVNFILDHDDVYDNIKGGEIEPGSSAFFALAAQAYNGRVGVSYAVIATVAFIIALLIGIAACVGVKVSYSMKARSVDYPLNRFAKMELKEQNDIFAGSFVTKRIIETNSGGRGGSRGGGGGHAGGR